jgi:futalosine hydrolase
MNILLVAATLFEIRPIVLKLVLIKKHNDQLTSYRHKDINVDILIPGIGMVQTAYFLGRQLAQKQYDLAINAGIAGTFNKSLALGSVVNVIEDCVAELGAEDGDQFLSVFELGLTDPEAHPYKGGKLVNDCIDYAYFKNNSVIGKLPKVKAITSNTVRGNAESIARIQRIAQVDIESMEGAAFFYACLVENVPCMQIRSVTNRVETDLICMQGTFSTRQA